MSAFLEKLNTARCLVRDSHLVNGDDGDCDRTWKLARAYANEQKPLSGLAITLEAE
jgi:hypothetical protein